MRYCLAALVLMPMAFARAGGDSPEALSRDMVAFLQEAKSVLAGIKDGKTAESARPKLDQLGKRLAKLLKREASLQKPSAKKPAADGPTAQQLSDLEKASTAVFKEMERVAKIPEAAKALQGSALVMYHARMQTARRDRARIDVMTLQRAAEAWFTQHGQYPPSLETLTQNQPGGARATLEPRSLIDPWGRPYVYEPNTRHPKTRRPLIYSQGPRPEDPAGWVRNWPDPEKK